MENNNQLIKALDLINEEDYTAAKAFLEEYLKHNENDIEALKNLGLCEVNLDNPTGAIEIFSKVIEKDEADAVSIFYLASCKARIGEKEEAIKYFE